MSYKERKSIINIFTSIIFNIAYVAIVYNKYVANNPERLEDLRFWGGLVVVMLVPIGIVVRIVEEIIHAIIHSIITQEEAPVDDDEMDKLIDLKSTRLSYVIFSCGFIAAMLALVFGYQIHVMFIMLLVSGGVIAEVVEGIAKLTYYRRGGF